LQPLVDRLGTRATLNLLQDADHSFHVPVVVVGADASIIAASV
jgi:hypothetical protein